MLTVGKEFFKKNKSLPTTVHVSRRQRPPSGDGQRGSFADG
jgi:hypothetical protein